MEVVVRSDVGQVRDINEDYTYVSEFFPNGLIFAVVCDGMGGHNAGEFASKTAVEKVSNIIESKKENNFTVDEYKDILEKAIIEANEEVYNLSIDSDEHNGMGTTIVAAIISPTWIISAHIGDSRAYLIDLSNIEQITEDHSLVFELLKNKKITIDEAKKHPQKNILTRALGTDKFVKVDINFYNWQEGQSLVLCSDGLTNSVDDSVIQEVVNDGFSIEQKAEKLLSFANNAGGEDNISLIIVRNK